MKESMEAAGGLVSPVVAQELGVALTPGTSVALGRRTMSRRSERGMVSAEWAVGIIAAIAMAGVLLSVVTSGPVQKAILGFVLQVIRHFAVGL